jgi:hypothetical protein
LAPPGSPAADTPTEPLGEAFQKGPITLTALVTRTLAGGERAAAPLFTVPVLRYQDRLDLSLAGEAFDPRVSRADWSLVVVFLPRTIAPTDQGVVDVRLKRGKDGRMGAAPIAVPYDSIPMLFLVPDSSGRKKVLKDLNDHLAQFRTLCARIADLSGERAVADKFLQDLDAIDKNLSPAQYDSALLGFVHNYGDQVSADLQGFLSGPNNNLAKCQFLTQEFRRTNVLVPTGGQAQTAAVGATVTAGTGEGRPICAYVSIFFDLAAIIHNLWPGHQFQYLPALARNFRGAEAELYYNDWIHTTGELRGALMCCPGRWEAEAPPEFSFNLAAGESLLRRQCLLAVQPRHKARAPFGLYGRDWKLLLTGPGGQALPPVPLDPSPTRQAFVAAPGAVQAALRKLGATRVQARIAGRWGFTSLATDPVPLAIGCDPAWTPSAAEAAGFQAGRACAFRFPGAWAGAIEAVRFRPSAPGGKPLAADLARLPDGALEARFNPGSAAAGPGTLEVVAFGSAEPALARPLTLLPAAPEPAGLEARLGETSVVLRGRRLESAQAVLIGPRRFRAVDPGTGELRTFQAEDGKPLEGTAGKALAAVLVTAQGRRPLPPAVLLPARPRLGETPVIPVAAKDAGLPVTAPVPIAPAGGPSQVSLVAGPGYRFPADGRFRIALRNAEDPGTVRVLEPAQVRVMGHNQKAAFVLVPTAVLGGGASGRLEVQVQDEHAGAGDWLALPATFLDLPAIGSVRAADGGFRLAGPSLDQIERVAPDPGGPWLKPAIAIEAGREVAQVAAPLKGDVCLKLFGWPDLVLTVKVPPEAVDGKPAPAASAPGQE